jgi:hypothetical protein
MFPTLLPSSTPCSAIGTPPPGCTPDETRADVDWDLLADGFLSTSEKAVVHIAHGCAVLERHGGCGGEGHFVPCRGERTRKGTMT